MCLFGMSGLRLTVLNIIPAFVTSAMPPSFGIIFLLTLLAAAISTIASQFHTAGTAIGRDVFEQLLGWKDRRIAAKHAHPNWPVVDPIVVSLTAMVAVVVSLATRPPDRAHPDRCFGNEAARRSNPGHGTRSAK